MWLALPILLFVRVGDERDLPNYRDVADQRGFTRPNSFGSPAKKLITETTGSGAAFFDYDGDGDLDLYVVNGKTLDQAERGAPGDPNQLFRNRGDGFFDDVTEAAGVGDTGWGGGAAATDYDNDGDTDLLVTNYGENVLYRNNADGTFDDVTARAGVSDPRWSTSAAFGDVDGDGFLDLYVANYIAFTPSVLDGLDPSFCIWRGVRVMCGPNGLPGERDALYRNRGDGTFEDVTTAAGVDNADGKGLGVVFVDFDEDGDQDIYVANDSTPDFLYQNDGRGKFEDVALLAGVAVSMYGKPQAGMGADAGDYDGDGRPDLFVTNFQGDYNALRHNDGLGMFTDVSDATGLTAPSFERLGWGAKLVDLNLDGFLDIFVVNGHVYPEVDGAGIGESYRQPNQLFLNLDGHRFEDVANQAGPGLAVSRSSRGLVFADIDDDGDLDAFINNISDLPTLLVDEADHANGWFRLTLVGRATNRDGLGVKLTIETEHGKLWRDAGSVWSYLSTNDRRLLVGIGGDTAGRVQVHWPSGSQDLGLIAAGQDALVIEGVGIVP
ncbi:MAG TPA: CRTAC1 family protein [Vicinamibacteria bacterium]|nr:CRTAC1 family protein [Vicinamibacteria bacterium]